jgi:hypothetical protein
MINEQHSFRVKICEEVTLRGISLREELGSGEIELPEVSKGLKFRSHSQLSI